jgi:hypothetical protein
LTLGELVGANVAVAVRLHAAGHFILSTTESFAVLLPTEFELSNVPLTISNVFGNGVHFFRCEVNCFIRTVNKAGAKTIDRGSSGPIVIAVCKSIR